MIDNWFSICMCLSNSMFTGLEVLRDISITEQATRNSEGRSHKQFPFLLPLMVTLMVVRHPPCEVQREQITARADALVATLE